MMLNEIRNKVLGGEKITVEEACWLSCKAEKQDLYDASSIRIAYTLLRCVLL